MLHGIEACRRKADFTPPRLRNAESGKSGNPSEPEGTKVVGVRARVAAPYVGQLGCLYTHGILFAEPSWRHSERRSLKPLMIPKTTELKTVGIPAASCPSGRVVPDDAQTGVNVWHVTQPGFGRVPSGQYSNMR